MQLVVSLGFYIHSAAEHLDEVGYYVVLEYLVIFGLKAVEYLAAHGDDGLKLGVPPHLARAERRIALHNIYLAAVFIARAAVHKLLHTV